MRIYDTIPKTYRGKIADKLPHNMVMVVGTNTEGRHGLGSARFAFLYHGLQYGKPYGRQGNSYGIVTKNLKSRYHPSIAVTEIVKQIKVLYHHARSNPETFFLISYGTAPNLNGYTPQQMAEMFSVVPIPDNVVFESHFAKLL